MSNRLKLLLLILPLFLLVQCAVVPRTTALRMNEIQFIGSHNSYKQAIDPPLLAMLAADNPQTGQSLDYAHLPLKAQLDLGLRKLELDIFYDPEGGRYATPLGIETLPGASPFDPEGVMMQQGYKVLHIQDIDFRSHCLLLRDCLASVVEWSRNHEGHLPIYILINAKSGVIDRPGFVHPLPFDAAAWTALDQEIIEATGDKLLKPDDLRGNSRTLREAVLAGWPTLDEVRGRILFVLDDSAEKKQSYMDGYPSLVTRAMFVDALEDTDEAAIRVVNDPVDKSDYIRSLVEQGFIVRTRADADTREARTGDRSRLSAALDSGAQIVSTDYYVVDERFDNDYLVRLPGTARCNVVLRSPCVINDVTD